MTEREKMLAGQLYKTNDPELAAGNPCRVIRKVTEQDSVQYKKNSFNEVPRLQLSANGDFYQKGRGMYATNCAPVIFSNLKFRRRKRRGFRKYWQTCPKTDICPNACIC